MDDGYHRVRGRLHDVFQHQQHIRRYIVQERLPELLRLLHEPHHKVHMGDEAAVEHHAADVELPRRLHGLAEAAKRHVPHQRVDGAGRQLRKGTVEPQAGEALRLPLHAGQGGGVVQQRSIAEGDDLAACAPLAGQRAGPVIHAGDMEFVLQGIDHTTLL